MAVRKPLRAVSDGEKPPAPRRRPSITEAAASGDHRELMVAMRERIATAVQDPNCPPRDLAALTRRLQEVAREIEALDAAAAEEGGEGGPVGDEAWDAQAL